MDKIAKIEKKFNVALPDSFKSFLEKFHEYMYISDNKNARDFELYSINTLIEETNYLPNKELLTCEKLRYLISENFQKQENGMVKRNDKEGFVSGEHVSNNSICFGGDDGTVLYFDIVDHFSVWEYWKDENSVGKLANSFEMFIENYEIDTYE